MFALHGFWDYCLATVEQIDTCNEIHKKLLDLNLQSMLVDEQLKELKQECSQRDGNGVFSFLNMAIEAVKEDQESTKLGLRELLVSLFRTKCFNIGNLEGFVLEQEVYELMMRTETDDNELKFLMTKIEGLLRFVDERNRKVNDLKMELDRVPKKLYFPMWELGQSDDVAQLFENRSTGNKAKSDVVVEMYGSPRDVASPMLVSEEFKKVSMFDDLEPKRKGFCPLDYLDH
ncbi:hypothetical protein PTKIN_Ptkin17bG0034700 [Pterospermum kingtungense]